MPTPINWNQLIRNLTGSHLLQTWEWGQVKARYGWKPLGIIWFGPEAGPWEPWTIEFQPGSDIGATVSALPWVHVQSSKKTTPITQPHAAALVLQRTLPIRGFSAYLRILYIPKGPLLDWTNASLRCKVLDDLQKYARYQRAIFIKIDPDVIVGEGVPGRLESQEDVQGKDVACEYEGHGWLFSNEQIQFRNTVLVNLTFSEDELLARMKPKTRYNIRLAERKGVTIRVGSPADWELLYRMYAETSLRDGFVIRGKNYYTSMWDIFSKNVPSPVNNQPIVEPLIAEVEGIPVAAVVIYRFAGKAWYLSGMSLDIHREKMPNHLLQWEAMRRAKSSGCTTYDLWGAPDNFQENDPLWGVFRFKDGLGGTIVRTLGAWDYPPHMSIYRLYTQIIPRLLDVMRWRGKSQTKQTIETGF